ncbi:hypothetical protein T484DRAFT_3476537 [Baffinella frigidus]|nr:hypothetical protein T484DRAFT_3476537 [Cryptophyta sp. CCMP2293]
MSVRLALPKESRPASAASNQRPRSAITPTEMRRMCAQPMRPKSARWIRPDEKEIMSSPISTFQRAAETVYKPSSSFGTGGRFDIAQAITSHFGETCGPDIGPGYDVRRSEQQTQFQFRSGIKYCPPVHPSTARQGRPLEITCEGGDPKFMPPSTFAGMATAHYNGQRAGTGMTAAMGSSSRFNGVGGLAGMGGKSYITPSATVGAKMQVGMWVQASGFRRQGSGFRRQASGFRRQASGFRLQASGFKLQASGFRLQGSTVLRFTVYG